MPLDEYLVIFMFLTFIGLILTGVPISYCLAGTGLIFGVLGYFFDQYFGTATGLGYNFMGIAVSRIYDIMTNSILVAMPLFIFMGLMLDRSGIAEELLLSAQELFGPIRGGLAITVTFIGVLLAASTGIIGASVVLLGLLSLPAMLKQGYSKSLALGTVAASGTLGILIPPSIMLVVMADQMSLSVGDLFSAALIPGLLLAFFYVVYIPIFAYINRDAAPLAGNRRPVSFSTIVAIIKNVVPAASLIIVVLGSIFLGIATVTEASGVGAFAALLLCCVKRKFKWKMLMEVLHNTFNTTAYIFAIIVTASFFALVLRGLGGDQLIERSLLSIPYGGYSVILVISLCVFMLGFFLDWIEIALIVMPLISPIIPMLGLEIPGFGVIENPDMIWFAVVMAVTLQTSFLTPPVGFALFYLRGVAPPDVKLADIYIGVIPFIIIQVVCLISLFVWPALATWLPAIMYNS